MRHRISVSLTLALLAVLANSGVASAAGLFEDRDGVMIGTGIVVLVMMAVLVVFYAVAHALGLDKMPPPDPTAGDHGAHH